MIFIHHHLGLGDHIVCNAIVRMMSEKYGKVLLAVKKHNLTSVVQLYRDMENLSFLVVKSDEGCLPTYFTYPTLRIGFERCKPDWEESFYEQLNIDYSARFENFFIDRDLRREKILIDKLNLPEKFIFCNNTSSKGKIDLPIRSDLPIVYLSPLTDSLFDWIGVLELAEEIHTIDSSIYQLIKQLPIKKRKVFYDARYLDPTRTKPPYKDDSWEIV